MRCKTNVPLALVGSLVFLATGTEPRSPSRLDAATGGEPRASASERRVFTGRVCLPNGSPAPGAVVVTSAGGRALTAADGSFAVEAEVPLDAVHVEVMAVASDGTEPGGLVASAIAATSTSSRLASAGRLVLALPASCAPRWLPAFGEPPGTDGRDISHQGAVKALATFDDGSGPALFVGGEFSAAGSSPADNLAKWDGQRWTGLQDVPGDLVEALLVFDDGSGPALYAGGVGAVGRWNGSSWASLGSGFSGRVDALAVFDDGTGPRLHAGGLFTVAGGVPAQNVARWDGASWTALGSGVSGGVPSQAVNTLATFDDGSGPALYAGGSFTSAGGVAASNLAKWDGSSWSAV